ncbi:MAG TPA: tRNA adenosine(34) deaminase TadA [Candidatus Cryosericum sp.]|nr:tRNA adenosine(34) deaminase TadA [Candidatus Cryosericum sp.]
MPSLPGSKIRSEDRAWMQRALRLARDAGRRGEVPIGAVLVLHGRAIGAGSNRTLRSLDPTAHAEIVALRRAARVVGNHRLTGATLYVTLEPCLMCFGALVHARIGRLVHGARDPKVGAISSLRSRGYPAGLNHRFAAEGGVLADDCAALLRRFFKARR